MDLELAEPSSFRSDSIISSSCSRAALSLSTASRRSFTFACQSTSYCQMTHQRAPKWSTEPQERSEPRASGSAWSCSRRTARHVLEVFWCKLALRQSSASSRPCAFPTHGRNWSLARSCSLALLLLTRPPASRQNGRVVPLRCAESGVCSPTCCQNQSFVKREGRASGYPSAHACTPLSPGARSSPSRFLCGPLQNFSGMGRGGKISKSKMAGITSRTIVGCGTEQ